MTEQQFLIFSAGFICGAGVTALIARRFYNRKLEQVIQYAASVIKRYGIPRR